MCATNMSVQSQQFGLVVTSGVSRETSISGMIEPTYLYDELVQSIASIYVQHVVVETCKYLSMASACCDSELDRIEREDDLPMNR